MPACPEGRGRIPRTWLFFILVFGWTWSFWIAAAASGTSVETTRGETLLLLGLLGPMLGGIGFTYLTQSTEEWREYWLRIVDPKRIGARWYIVILLFVPSLMVLAALFGAAAGDMRPFQIEPATTAFLTAPFAIMPFLLRTFLHGPLPEELGWRGYAIDQLQASRSALVSSLILGAIWALWHLPLFFIRGMVHSGRATTWYLLFVLQAVATTVIFTWIYNNTRRSILAAVLFHFMTNLTYELAKPTASTNAVAALLWVIAAVVVVTFWGGDRLKRPSTQ